MFLFIRKKDLKDLIDIFMKNANEPRREMTDFDFGYNTGIRDTCEHLALALHIDLEKEEKENGKN